MMLHAFSAVAIWKDCGKNKANSHIPEMDSFSCPAMFYSSYTIATLSHHMFLPFIVQFNVVILPQYNFLSSCML